MSDKRSIIDIPLVRRLIEAQFPQWKDLPIRPIEIGGWDNRTFHLGHQMLVRMPSAAEYAPQIEKEYRWLPQFAPLLPLQIPEPLAMGNPGDGYYWKWSIYKWLEGESAISAKVDNLCEFAASLARFLIAFQLIDSTGGPTPGLHSFYRGGSLTTYDPEVQHALKILNNKIDCKATSRVWEMALSSTWKRNSVWIHGDISVGNILVRSGKISAVIDFGQLAIGDPACDLVIAWTLFNGKSREIFHAMLPLDGDTWARARGWALWKALIVAAAFTNPGNPESVQCFRIIDEVCKTI